MVSINMILGALNYCVSTLHRHPSVFLPEISQDKLVLGKKSERSERTNVDCEWPKRVMTGLFAPSAPSFGKASLVGDNPPAFLN